jgi:hypothetical protein
MLNSRRCSMAPKRVLIESYPHDVASLPVNVWAKIKHIRLRISAKAASSPAPYSRTTLPPTRRTACSRVRLVACAPIPFVVLRLYFFPASSKANYAARKKARPAGDRFRLAPLALTLLPEPPPGMLLPASLGSLRAPAGRVSSTQRPMEVAPWRMRRLRAKANARRLTS